jgi:hypothetical protein
MSSNGNKEFIGLSYPSLNTFTNFITNDLKLSTAQLSSLSVAKSPYVGTTIIATLPSSFTSSPFLVSQPILLTDINNNYVSLPLSPLNFLILANCHINNLGPDTTKGGTWTGPLIKLGLSALSPVAITNNIASGAPWNFININIDGANGFATGTNNYTGAFQYNHVGTGATGVGTMLPLLTQTDATYLAVEFFGTSTPGTGYGVGTLTFYLSYAQL